MSERPAPRWLDRPGAAASQAGPDAGPPLEAGPAGQTARSWATRTLGALLGVGAAALFLLWLSPHLHAAYRPFDGIVGPPAFADRAPGIELWLYGIGVAACGLLGACGAWLARRGGPFTLSALGILLLAEGVFGIFAWHAGWIPPSRATALSLSFLSNPIALGELALLAGAAWWLSRPAHGSVSAERRAGFSRESDPEAHAAWADASRRFVPPFLLLGVVLVGAMPRAALGLALALPLALAAAAAWRPVGIPREGTHFSQRLERAAWALLALSPAGLWLLRLGRTLEWPLPPAAVIVVGGLALAILPPLCSGYRRRRGWDAAVRPESLLPWTLVWLLLLGSAAAQRYDAFHQGEYSYPIQALRRGLLPWRDVFLVHGLGFDGLGGVLMGVPGPRTRSLDLTFHVAVAALCGGLALRFYLAAWGRSWWLAALLTAGLTAIVGGPLASRYVGVWLALLLVHSFLRTGRLGWLAAAGSVGALGTFYALDSGALVLAGVGLWTLVWGGAIAGRRIPGPAKSGRLAPGLAFGLGAAVVLLPAGVALWHLGLVTDVWEFHVHYLRIKHHYDELPFELYFAAALVGPAAGVLGLWACWGIVRARDTGALAGLVLLLTGMNLLAFLRALDRSDTEHLVYATILAWPLLATLAVRQAECGLGAAREPGPAAERETRVRAPASRAWTRGIVIAAVLISLPYTHRLISGGLAQRGQPLTLPIHWYWTFYPKNVRQPLGGPLVDPASRSFFEIARQVETITGAPGAGSLRIDRRFYDFSNHPAVYTWTGLTPPTRFFTAYHAATRPWQEEVVQGLERAGTRWVLWRGPREHLNHPDGMPNWMRQWRIAEFLLAHYRPSRRLAGEGRRLRVDGQEVPGFTQHDGLLLERVEGANDRARAAAATRALEPLWLEPADLGEVPAVWGRGGPGAPATPARLLLRTDLNLAAGAPGVAPVGDAGEIARATELHVSFDPPVDARCTLTLGAGERVDPRRRLGFRTHAGFAGPYRVRVASIPGFVWGEPPTLLVVELVGAVPPRVRVELRALADTAGPGADLARTLATGAPDPVR